MTAVPLQTGTSTASGYGSLQFVIETILKRIQTAMPVKVVAVTNEGGVEPVGFVDVVPLINQVTGDGTVVAHATIFHVPYFRLQGNTNAIILDPQVGDIGLCVFASRDISALKADPQAAIGAGPEGGVKGAPPGSARTYNFADGLYVGGFLNGTPEQFVQFYSEGIRVVSPTKIRAEAPIIEAVATERITAQAPLIEAQATEKITAEAPVIEATADERITLEAPTIELKGNVVQSAGNITATGTVTADGDVTGAGISLSTHVHGGVSSGGSNTGPPA